MAEISQIKLPNGTTYDIKDATARAQVGGAIILRGTTTTALADEATTNPITINGSSYTAVANDAVFYNKKEFVFDGTKWHEFGDMSGLGALATKDSASGTVAVPKTYTSTSTFSGTGVRLETDSQVLTGASFSGTSGTVSVSGTPTGTISKGTGAANYTPQGSNAASSVSGSCSVTATGSISTGTGTANYTPAGTISVSSAGSTASIEGMATVGTLPSATMPTFTVASGTEVLTITAGSFSAGTLPTKATAVNAKTSDASYSFAGTGAELKFTGTAATGTISGTAAAQTFTGTGAELKFTGSSMTSTGSFTPSGSIGETKSKVTVSPASSGTATYTPSGSVVTTTTTATTENKTVTVS